MKRERIEELLATAKEHDSAGVQDTLVFPTELIDLCDLALRATDPEFVLVPIMDVIDIGKEPFKDGACGQCYPHQEYTKPGFRCIYHEAADKYRAHFQEDQQ